MKIEIEPNCHVCKKPIFPLQCGRPFVLQGGCGITHKVEKKKDGTRILKDGLYRAFHWECFTK